MIPSATDLLNDYDGDDIWQDVILGLPGYNEDATASLDPHGFCDVVVAGGIIYRYSYPRGEWEVS